MTLPSSSKLSMSQIQTEFGYGNSLSGYRNVRVFRDNNSRVLFANTNISFSAFYSKRKSSPVVANNATISTAGNFTIPMFNTLTVTAYSGQGGQGGIAGNCNGGGNGGDGGASSMADYATSGTGPGGAPSGNYGTRSSNTITITIDDSNQDSVLARYNVAKAVTIGAGGGGGATGYNQRAVTSCALFCFQPYFGYYCCANRTDYYCDSPTGGGAGGAAGYVYVEWS